jgi:hypothetical protein
LALLLLALGFSFLGVHVSVRRIQPELQPLHHIQHVERAGCSPREQVVVDYEREFPHEMTCSYFGADNLNYRKNVTIALAYHVGMYNNWKNVVLDQLQTLHQCGLGHAARHLLLSYSGDDEMSQIAELIEPFDFSFHLVRVVQPKRAPWEGLLMNAIQQYCEKRPEAVMYYFHSKGVGKYHDDWRKKTDKSFTYSRVLYWRKFMEYFTLERPQLCLEEILGKNKSACGVNFRRDPLHHYSGNFWVASCEYLATLTPLNFSDPSVGYLAAEFWMGRKYDESRFVNLWHRKLNLSVQLYEHWMEPREYRFPEDLLNVNGTG